MCWIGQSGAWRFRTEDVKVRLSDLAGLANTKADLAEINGHLADPGAFMRSARRYPRAGCC